MAVVHVAPRDPDLPAHRRDPRRLRAGGIARRHRFLRSPGLRARRPPRRSGDEPRSVPRSGRRAHHCRDRRAARQLAVPGRRTHVKPLMILIGAASLAACAVGPDYARPNPKVAGDFRGAREASYQAGAPVVEFWRTFDDPVLTLLI